jgi:hypothetical protein
MDSWIPYVSSGEIVDITWLEAAVPRRAATRWKAPAGPRRFPCEPGGMLESMALLVASMLVLRGQAYFAMPQSPRV